MQTSNPKVAASHVIKLDCTDLLPGMFICELDCAWADTPFSIDGFHLRTVDDIELVRKFCKIVHIDINLGSKPKRLKRSQLTILSSARRAAPESAALKVDLDTYPTTHSIKQQLGKALKSYEKIKLEFDAFSARVSQKGDEGLNLKPLEQPLLKLIDVIVANPQTLIWILNTESAMSVSKQHSNYCIRAAIWASILGRQVGMSRVDIRLLFQGTLLADIGLNLLPEKLVYKRGPFRKKEFLAYAKHVEFGYELISQHPLVDDKVAGIVRCHHERHDGLGFPRGINGKQIPRLARIANLAYCYERLLRINTSQRVSPAAAMSRLYKQRELKFSQQIVLEFIHVMGMYPVGTVVDLASGEQALILEQNLEQKLYPKIAITTNKDQAVLKTPKIVDLAKSAASNSKRVITGAPARSRTKVISSKYADRFFWQGNWLRKV